MQFLAMMHLAIYTLCAQLRLPQNKRMKIVENIRQLSPNSSNNMIYVYTIPSAGTANQQSQTLTHTHTLPFYNIKIIEFAHYTSHRKQRPAVFYTHLKSLILEELLV